MKVADLRSELKVCGPSGPMSYPPLRLLRTASSRRAGTKRKKIAFLERPSVSPHTCSLQCNGTRQKNAGCMQARSLSSEGKKGDLQKRLTEALATGEYRDTVLPPVHAGRPQMAAEYRYRGCSQYRVSTPQINCWRCRRYPRSFNHPRLSVPVHRRRTGKPIVWPWGWRSAHRSWLDRALQRGGGGLAELPPSSRSKRPSLGQRSDRQGRATLVFLLGFFDEIVY